MVDIEKCHITHYPAKVLAEPSKPIDKIDDNIRQLVEKMTEIMFTHKGIGLAGPQAGVPLRIFIVCLDGNKDNLKVYINPTVTCSGDIITNEEGCLSVPGIFTNIRRYEKCTITATDLNGRTFTDEADGLYARCLQHEFDHIEGTTIVNRMTQTAKIMHRRKLKKLRENNQ